VTDSQLPPQSMLDLPPAKIPFDHATRAGEPHDYPIPPLEQKGRVECMQCHEWLAFDRFTTCKTRCATIVERRLPNGNWPRFGNACVRTSADDWPPWATALSPWSTSRRFWPN